MRVRSSMHVNYFTVRQQVMSRIALSKAALALLAGGVLGSAQAMAEQVQASFAVAVTLHAASKLPAVEKLCPAGRPMDLLGVAIRVDCPEQTSPANTKTASSSPTQPRLQRPPEITVTY